MKAAIYRGNRRFSVEDRSCTAPAAGQVQIEVAYCGICGTDLHVFQGHMDARVGFERVIGHEMSGKIKSIGADVEGFSVGETVVVRPIDSCGECPACEAGHAHVCHNLNFVGLDSEGAFQRFWNVDAALLHKVPNRLSLMDAAFIEPVAVVCHAARRSRLKAGEFALVIGAGPIGLLMAMLARAKGARVAIAEVSSFRRDFAESQGFHVLPTEAEAMKLEIEELTNSKGADVVYEVSGSAPASSIMTELASVRGRITMVAIHAQPRDVDLFRMFWRELELIGTRVYQPEDYDEAIALLDSGEMAVRPLVTHIGEIDNITQEFEALLDDPSAMKALIKIGEFDA